MDYIEYKNTLKKVEELLDSTSEETPKDSHEMIELIALSNKIEEYESIHYALPEPNFLNWVRFYFEQRYKFTKLKTLKKKP